MKPGLFWLVLFVLLPCVGMGQVITTVAGKGTAGFSGDGGTALSAELKRPNSMAFDQFGNMYFTDAGNLRIRKINTSGVVSTVAGNGITGFSGDNGPATQAQLDVPVGIAVDHSGNLYISTGGDHRIRKVNSTGIITTIAGDGTYGYNGDGIAATSAKLYYPYVGVIDDLGNVYFSDYNNHRVRKISASGIISTIAGNGTTIHSGDNGPATAAGMIGPSWMFLCNNGDLYVADNADRRIRKIENSGIISTVAGNGAYGNTGDGGPATNATFVLPNGVCVDNSGNIYIADAGSNVIRKVNTAGNITTIAGTGVSGFSGDGGAAILAQINLPNFVTINQDGNLFIADYNNNRIRMIVYNNSVNQTENSGALSISPNPATSQIAITAPNKIKEVSVWNMVGQKVLTQQCNTLKTELNISDLPAGVYFVVVCDEDGGRVVSKVVKQ